MFLILAVIAFVYLTIRFFALAAAIDWCLEKIVASAFYAFAFSALFVNVIIESFVFLLLPLAFVLVAIEVLGAGRRAEPVRQQADYMAPVSKQDQR